MKTLNEYKVLLGITTEDIAKLFDVPISTVTSWLNRGAPIQVLRDLQWAVNSGIKI